MVLNERISIARRFLRSIRIDSDLNDAKSLEGFVCPQSSAEVLSNMARHVSETGQGAFTWTGPYGSGKSSLVVALSALLNGNVNLQKQASKVFGRKLTNTITKSLPTGTKGWQIVPVVGRREDPVKVIGEAIYSAGFITRRPRGGWTEDKLVNTVKNAAQQKPKTHGGLIIFIDEMGKFLEAAAQDGVDIYIFQQLAEAASRSDGRLIIVGILHQAFEEYAHRLSHENRDEWTKIQGRFIDLAVNVVGDEQIELISRAIENKYNPTKPSNSTRKVASLIRQDRSEDIDIDQLALTLESCWPLHPVVTCLLGPISRRRFGQNQRSIFGFLNSAEPHGFQDFLKHAENNTLYKPENLWDYLRANLEPSILASPDGHRWALAAEALERCESTSGDDLHIRLLKTIAVIDLFKERSGLVANYELLKTCFPDISGKALNGALRKLENWSFTIFKKFLDAHAIYAGSDFDIDQAVESALENVDDIDFKELKALAGLQPILAKRHYHDTGTLRWFDVNLAPLGDLKNISANYKPQTGTIGQFLLAIPTEGESEEECETVCREAARFSDDWDIVVGYSQRSWAIVTLARELIALEIVRNERPELAGDAVARREVSARLASLQGQLETELHRAFDGALWFRKHHMKMSLNQADLNSLASELAEQRYYESPILHNELLNRQKPSGSAIAAQNALLRNMVNFENQPNLGIEGFPAEGGLYSSILGATKLHTKKNGEWQFIKPSTNNNANLPPMWKAAEKFIKANKDRPVAISELYNIWRDQPIGIKDGLMPVLSVAFILSQRNSIAIYRDGIFRARFDEIDVEYLAKDPDFIQLRWMDLSSISRRLLSEMAGIVRNLDEENTLVHLEPIDVARGLINIYQKLPQWTKRTMQLSSNAIRIRDLFKRARDPNQLLFDDIPKSINKRRKSINEEDLHKIIQGVSDGLEELVQAYPAMLTRLRDLMFSELQVPNASPQSIAELRERAENIRQISGDFHLEAFVGRLSQFDGSRAALEGLASLAASKPPANWVDSDLDRATLDIAEMAQKFIRAETYTRVKGRPEKRQSMAIVIGMDGRPAPILEEFDISDTDRIAINKLIEHVTDALDESDTKKRNIILAALAEISARYMQKEDKSKESNNRAAS